MQDDPLSIDEKADRLVGNVKWFNVAKSYGFVVVSGYSSDFLLHRNALRNYGSDYVEEGAEVEFEYITTAGRQRVTKVISIEACDKLLQVDEPFQCDHVFESRMPARVKWFDDEKGFGFVNCYGSSEDIFLSFKDLHRCGLIEVQVGQAICVQVGERNGRKRVHRICDWINGETSGSGLTTNK